MSSYGLIRCTPESSRRAGDDLGTDNLRRSFMVLSECKVQFRCRWSRWRHKTCYRKEVSGNGLWSVSRQESLRELVVNNAINNFTDPLSLVDVMKSYGLVSSREGGLRYAREHGIGGQPFSAAWADGIRLHIQQQNRR